ncbi:tRNA (adenine(37)-N6)-methyltransferase [Eurosta solidaginis]|uniref:tRNA (adenine(37)-N6)-methyltransferase n=1 Tax=Eurosta solidaginis TaxID=178769 RepID=UPI003530CB80
MLKSEVLALQNQLTIARNEISKLRQQVRNLQHVQRKDIDSVACLLREFRCEGCRRQTAEENARNSNVSAQQSQQTDGSNSEACGGVHWQHIGVIRTAFPEKRAVPRQSNVGGRLRGLIELNSNTFTNPAHASQGLEEYSHMWLIYHFHKNNVHPKAKVAPPRLGGERVGVFSTRSPHRPCPIGLSLVEIEKVDGATITFFGTDMVDGTPLLDIKPYIPFYDAPAKPLESGRISVGPLETYDFYDSRQEPDGEESELEMLAAGATGGSNSSSDDTGLGAVGIGHSNNHISSTPPNIVNHATAPASAVRVPNWVAGSQRLKVCFNERAESQLKELQVHRQCIIDILEADPRSVYLRTKYGSQIFTFQLSEVTVTCKFDDKAAMVTVVQIRRTENVQDEELPE